jgi:hypothetical protein
VPIGGQGFLVRSAQSGLGSGFGARLADTSDTNIAGRHLSRAPAAAGTARSRRVAAGFLAVRSPGLVGAARYYGAAPIVLALLALLVLIRAERKERKRS